MILKVRFMQLRNPSEIVNGQKMTASRFQQELDGLHAFYQKELTKKDKTISGLHRILDGHDIQIEQLKLKLRQSKMTTVEINHIVSIMDENERQGWYFAPEEQYWKRHARIKEKLCMSRSEVCSVVKTSS